MPTVQSPLPWQAHPLPLGLRSKVPTALLPWGRRRDRNEWSEYEAGTCTNAAAVHSVRTRAAMMILGRAKPPHSVATHIPLTQAETSVKPEIRSGVIEVS
jgi:hypothetical protein